MTGVNVLFCNWYLLGVKYISSHAHKTGSSYLLGRGSFQYLRRATPVVLFCLELSLRICT